MCFSCYLSCLTSSELPGSVWFGVINFGNFLAIVNSNTSFVSFSFSSSPSAHPITHRLHFGYYSYSVLIIFSVVLSLYISVWEVH